MPDQNPRYTATTKACFVLAKLLLCLSFSLTANAGHQPVFVTFASDNHEGVRLINNFHQVVTAQAGITAELKLLPGKQALYFFKRSHAVALQGRKCSIEENPPALKSRPFDHFRQYLIRMKGQPAIEHVGQLRNMTIGLAHLQTYDLPSKDLRRRLGLKFHTVKSYEILLKMLHRHRVDAIIASPALLAALAPELFQNQQFSFDLSKPFYLDEICYLVQDTPHGRQTVEKLNAALDQLEKSGKLQQLNYHNLDQIMVQNQLKTPLIQDLEALEEKLQRP